MSNLTDWAWAAGFFDGEGSVHVRRKKTHPSHGLQVQQNMREPLDELSRILGGSVMGPYTRRRSRDPNVISNPYWVWRLSKQEDVYHACLMIYPYLKVKGEEVNAASEAIRERLGMRG